MGNDYAYVSGDRCVDPSVRHDVFHCVIKAHVVNGKVVNVEPDDRYNKNIGREDEVLADKDLSKVKL